MSQPSLYRGDLVSAFPSVVTTAGVGTSYALTPIPGQFTKKVTWSYSFTTAPSAIVINLEASLDGVNFFQYDTYNTPGTTANRSVDIGQNNFVRLNVISLTLGSGAGIGGNIGY